MDIPTKILRSLNETIIWCTYKANYLQAEESTRTIDVSSVSRMGYGNSNTEDRQEIVNEVCEARRRLLAADGLIVTKDKQDLAGGKILIYEIDNTDSCGLSPVESNGYIDGDDMPGWDTWFHFLQHPTRGDCILSWVPPSFIVLTMDAIDVNPFDCISFGHLYAEINA